jgi:hypothetical protein
MYKEDMSGSWIRKLDQEAVSRSRVVKLYLESVSRRCLRTCVRNLYPELYQISVAGSSIWNLYLGDVYGFSICKLYLDDVYGFSICKLYQEAVSGSCVWKLDQEAVSGRQLMK